MSEMNCVGVITYNPVGLNGTRVQPYISDILNDAHSVEEAAAIHALTTEGMDTTMKVQVPSFTINEDTVKQIIKYIGYLVVSEDKETELRLIYARPGIYPSSIENNGKTWTTIRLTPDTVLTTAIITPYDFLLVDYNKKVNKYVGMTDGKCQKVIDHINDSIFTNGKTIVFNAPSPLKMGRLVDEDE